MSFILSFEYPGRLFGPLCKDRALTKAASTAGWLVKPSDIEKCFTIDGRIDHSDTYAPSAWTPPTRQGQTMQVCIMPCEGYTYLVAILTPMQYSWCIEISMTNPVANALDQIMSECGSQGVCVGVIESGRDRGLINSEVCDTATLHDIHLAERTGGAPAPHAERRMREIKSAHSNLTSHLSNPIFSEITRYVAIEANSQVNRRRSFSTGHRPHEDFMQKRMVYSVDVGLQIGTPCIGTTIDGREHVGVYLYPEPMSGTHLTFHMEDGSTGSKTDIEPTTEEILWGSVHYESDSDDSTPEATNTSLTMEDAEYDHAPAVTRGADHDPNTESGPAGRDTLDSIQRPCLPREQRQ
jgi:hypothetical protein